jgi:uncharacterized protein
MFDSTGNFIWYELHATDVEAASTFYSEVVGWRAGDVRVGEVTYEVLRAGERSIAAVVGAAASDVRQAAAHWISYVAVENLDAAVDGVERLGGSVRQSLSDVQGVGRRAIVVDPQGAPIGLFSPDPSRARRDAGD